MGAADPKEVDSMNTSPFTSWSEFEASKDAMYAFADSPVVIGILTVLAVLIFGYWLYSTLAIPEQHEHDGIGG